LNVRVITPGSKSIFPVHIYTLLGRDRDLKPMKTITKILLELKIRQHILISSLCTKLVKCMCHTHVFCVFIVHL
jgi:hypothetical protein